jgi:hypothetical protein
MMRLVHRCYATPRAYRNRIQPYSLVPPVPRFFFHLYDDMVALDPEGKQLPDAAAAKEEAIQNARQIACAEVMKGHLGLGHRIEVTDVNDAPVATITFKDVIKLHP